VNSRTNSPVDTGLLAKRGSLGIVFALVVNLVVLTTVLLLDLLPEYEALAYGPVVTFTILGVVGGGVVYAVLDRVSENPKRLFTRMAVGVMLLSFLPNIGLYRSEAAVTLGIAVTLMGMHVPPAIASIGAFTGQLDSLIE
jgi:hypothetical protein